MKKIVGIVIITAISLLLSYLFNFLFLKLSERSPLDQFLLIFFLTCALAWIFYFIWTEGLQIHIPSRPNLRLDKHTLIDNLPSFVLGTLFFLIYLYFGSKINPFGVDQVDNLFDADITSWIKRIAFEDVKYFEMRGPHPFTYFIFRPFGWVFNFITNNDPRLSAIIFSSLAGGACVCLTWLFIKRQFQNKVYATLIASLLGLSASHLFFSSVIDTYIFSAFSLILFFLLLQSENKSIKPLVFAGIITFGITLTNFVQNFIGFIIAKPRLKEIIRFTGWVISFSLILTFLHAFIYPSSKLFFLTPDIENEQKFFAETFQVPQWKFKGRNVYLVRTTLLYTVVAPKAFILTEEVGSLSPEFRFYKISPGTFHQTKYEGLGKGLISVWLLMLVISGIVFIWNLIRTRKVDATLAFLGCIAFNFVIHLFYGQELFLYSADWAYALIFFVAFGLAPFAKSRFFQTGMLVFLILLAYHQWQFMQIIIETISQYVNS